MEKMFDVESYKEWYLSDCENLNKVNRFCKAIINDLGGVANAFYWGEPIKGFDELRIGKKHISFYRNGERICFKGIKENCVVGGGRYGKKFCSIDFFGDKLVISATVVIKPKDQSIPCNH